jgi:hypothetical protein
MNPTPDVSSRYGAPMGRRDDQIDWGKRLYLRRVPIDSGGYDPGGAYWGLGRPLYALGDGEGWRFYRGTCRADIHRQAGDDSDVLPLKFFR